MKCQKLIMAVLLILIGTTILQPLGTAAAEDQFGVYAFKRDCVLSLEPMNDFEIDYPSTSMGPDFKHAISVKGLKITWSSPECGKLEIRHAKH